MKRIFTLVIALIVVGLVVISAQDTARMQQIAQEMEQVQADFIAGKISPQQLQRRLTELNRQLEEARRSMASTGPSFSQAQLQRIETLLDQDKRLLAQFNEKSISEASYTQQATAVRNELNQIIAPFSGSPSATIQYAEVEEKINKLWPGQILGWPPDSVFTERNWPVLRQPAGTRASYSLGSWTDDTGRRPNLDDFLLYLSNATEADYQNLKRQIETGNHGTFNEDNGHTMYIEYEVSANGTHMYHNHNIGLNNGIIRYDKSSATFDMGEGSTRRD